MESSASDFTQVIFHDIEEIFSFHTPLKCSYTIESVLTPTSKDWIGLFKLGWRTVKEYVYFEWSPLPDNLESRREVDNFVIFKAENLPKDTSEFYQFLYVASSGKVCGASPPFQFRNPACSEFVEVDETPSMLIVHPKVSSSGSEPRMENFSSFPDKHGSLSSEGLVFQNSEEVEKLRKLLTDSEQEVSSLKADNNQLEQKLQHYLTDANVSTQQNDSKLTAALSEVNALKQQLGAEESAKKKLEELLQQRTTREETLSTELVKKEKELGDLTHKLSAAESDAVARLKTLDSVKQQKEQLADENNKLKHMVETYSLRQLELQAENENLKKEIVKFKAEAELNALTARNAGHTAAGAAVIPSHIPGASNYPATGDGASNAHRQSGTGDGATGGAAASGGTADCETFTCPYCEVTFPTSVGETSFMDHVASHEEKICPVCQSTFLPNIPIRDFEAHVDECLAKQT